MQRLWLRRVAVKSAEPAEPERPETPREGDAPHPNALFCIGSQALPDDEDRDGPLGAARR